MPRGRTKREQEAIDRYWEGMPVVEAKHPLMIYPNKLDRKRSVPGDPQRCQIAIASKRQFSSTAVVILRTRAYIDLENDKGEREVNRFIIPAPTLRKIIEFDKTHIPPPGGLLLIPPSPSQTLEAQRGREQKRLSLIRGGKKIKRKKHNKRSNVLTAQGVRDGHGMVHFNDKGRDS